MALSHSDFRLFREYTAVRLRFLAAIGCHVSCRDPLAEFSEWLVCKHLGGTAAASRVQKGYDLIRTNGRLVQVRYLSNPSERWVNEHHVDFSGNVDDYALVVFEAFAMMEVLIFRRETIAEVCRVLGKRHPGQDRGLQLTRRNVMQILRDRGLYEKLGVEILHSGEIAAEMRGN